MTTSLRLLSGKFYTNIYAMEAAVGHSFLPKYGQLIPAKSIFYILPNISGICFFFFFRIHAEFQLNEPPFTPMWFTPGQFAGHVTMSKDGKHIYDFHMYVPSDKQLNVGEYLFKLSTFVLQICLCVRLNLTP